jgi:transcriptional regulator with XRE-family HTH domain
MSSEALSADEAALRTAVGRRIGEARRAQGMTGRRLAELARVTPAFVSQVERGQVTPSLVTLQRLATALGLKVGDVLDPGLPPAGRVVSPDDWRIVTYPDGSFEDAFVAIDARERLELVWTRLAPHASAGEDGITHGAEVQIVFVLKGEVELVLGEERHRLRPRWSAMFPGNVPHGYRNPTGKPAEFVSIMTPAVYSKTLGSRE